MTNKQKIELFLCEVRSHYNEAAGPEGGDFSEEIRSEADALQSKYCDLKTRHRAASALSRPCFRPLAT